MYHSTCRRSMEEEKETFPYFIPGRKTNIHKTWRQWADFRLYWHYSNNHILLRRVWRLPEKFLSWESENRYFISGTVISSCCQSPFRKRYPVEGAAGSIIYANFIDLDTSKSKPPVFCSAFDRFTPPFARNRVSSLIFGR